MAVVESRDALSRTPRYSKLPAGRSEPAWRPALRLAIATLVAAGLSELIWRAVPDRFVVHTPVIGYPTFYDFDFPRYFAAFALLAILFPVLVFAVHEVLSANGPLRRPRPVRPLLPVGEATPTPSEQVGWPIAAACSLVGRTLVPALAVMLEVSAASSTHALHVDAEGIACAAAYVTAVLGAGAAVSRWGRQPFADTAALVNAHAAPVVVLLVSALSSTTSVTVLSDHHVAHYPWFPWWIALPAALCCELYVVGARRRSQARDVEGRLLAVVVGTVLVYLLTAGLTGAQGPFDAFDPQELAGAQLVFDHGLLPWKDIFLLHGFIEDALDGEIGMALLSHSSWGAFAGIDLVVVPVAFCCQYLMAVYFARGNRLIALLAGVAIVSGQTAVIMRFAYLPLLVVLFDRALRTKRRGPMVAFAAVLVLECALVPEIALMAAAFLVVVVVRDVLSRVPGTRWISAARLTVTFVAGAAASGVCLLVYLLATGSLSGFVDYYRLFSSDHALWGALPTQWSWATDFRITAYFVLPVVLSIAAVAAIVCKLRRRRGVSSRDWTMLACAVFVLLYFQKGLDRADVGHVVEVYAVAVPLVLLWGVVAVEEIDAGLARLLARRRTASDRASHARRRRRAPRPVALLGAVAVLALVPSVFTKVNNAPGSLHATAPTEPVMKLLGYEVPGQFPYAEVDALKRLLDVYAGRSGPVFDFANEPDITYFLLNRVPGSSFFHVETAQTLAAQRLVISELERSRPRVVIFTDQDFGLPLSYDKIPGMVRQWLVSQYLLDHYTPIANAYGQILMLRSDLLGSVPSVKSLHIPGVAVGGLYSDGQSCNWGDVPNFFVAPPRSSETVRATVTSGQRANLQITGWAVDATQLRPASEVFAVSDGKVIGTATPDIYRLDIEQYFKTPSVVTSGWSMDVELPNGQRVQLYSINGNGTVSRLQPNPAPAWLRSSPKITSVIGPSGRRYRIFRGRWLPGWTNFVTRVSARLYQVSFPPNTDLARFQWLTISGRSLAGARYVMGNQPAVVGHQVEFEALRTAPTTMSVRVGSCLDWHAFGRVLQLIVYRSGTAAPSPLSVSVSDPVPTASART